jgi:hypothetical protein
VAGPGGPDVAELREVGCTAGDSHCHASHRENVQSSSAEAAHSALPRWACCGALLLEKGSRLASDCVADSTRAPPPSPPPSKSSKGSNAAAACWGAAVAGAELAAPPLAWRAED